MKRFGKLKLFGLVAFLTAALIFVGIDYLEGKKPPKWEWKVGIPDIELAGQEDFNCNLYGHSPTANKDSEGYIAYEKNDFVDVEYWTSEDKDTGEIHSTFSLKLENTEKGISDDPGDYSIGFRDLQFTGCKTYCSQGGEGPCRSWVFPNYSLTPAGVDCCTPYCCGRIDPATGCYSDGFKYMQEFMEEYNHPSFGYNDFSLRIIVYCDIEDIEQDDPVTVDGYMWHLNVSNTGDTLLSGDEKYHNIVCAYWILLEDVLVERTGENEWKITVDQCGFNDPGENNCASKYGHTGRYIVFYEYYNQGIEKPIGKSGKSKIDSEKRWALGAATPFKFITKWTRL
jgi:hypothetical protein